MRPDTDIRPYGELARRVRTTNVATDLSFQHLYRRYWQMNAARLGVSFVGGYFAYFETLKASQSIALERVVRDLYALPTHGDGRQSVQFSFATKMVHMLCPQSPVYDSMVESFYHLPYGSAGETAERKLQRLLRSHQFLTTEYERILNERLLHPAITRFRQHFSLGEEYTDHKIIDTLLWQFVIFARSGAITDGTIKYC